MDNEKLGKLLDQVEANKEINAAKEQADEANRIGEMLVEHHTNDEGELLAHVHESLGFQEVYDYKGGQRRRHRLGRKAEQVHNQTSASTMLFQKVYYAEGLTHDDETKLRTAFWAQNETHNQMGMAVKAGLFLGWFPLTYRLARVWKPTSLVMMSGAYYFGLHEGLIQPFMLQRMQDSLNHAAEPFAAKYGVKH